MGGDKDFNVPIVGGEQMYQALRMLGVPTRTDRVSGPEPRAHPAELLKDRYDRTAAWFGRYLQPRPPETQLE